METVQLLLQVILLSLLGIKLVLQVQVVSEEHKFEDILRQPGHFLVKLSAPLVDELMHSLDVMFVTVRFLVISNDTRALALVQGVQPFLQAGHCSLKGFYLPRYYSVCPLEFSGPVHCRLEAFLEECFKALNTLLEEVDAAVGII